jgi:hypothetical protein
MMRGETPSELTNSIMNGGLAVSLQDFTPARPVLKGRQIVARDSSAGAAGAGGGLAVGKKAIHTLMPPVITNQNPIAKK